MNDESGKEPCPTCGDMSYIVVGSEMPNDVFIPWEDRDEVVNYA